MVCNSVCVQSCSLFLLIPVRCYTWEKVGDKCGITQCRGCGSGVDWMGYFRLVVLYSIQRMDVGVSVGERSSPCHSFVLSLYCSVVYYSSTALVVVVVAYYSNTPLLFSRVE